MTDAEIGETIAGYVLEEQLGEGSTSRVFVGRHRTAGRRAAIKVLTFSVLESRDARERLLREARSVNDIEHPNIANVYGLHESERPPRVALIMEWVKGPSLRTLRGSPLGPPAARRFALELVSAVRAAHAAHVIHRDLKPDNILFTEHPHSETASLKVVDFGLAKRLG
ncbi:MAG: protein kinase, partial [Myxococcota bacterium]